MAKRTSPKVPTAREGQAGSDTKASRDARIKADAMERLKRLVPKGGKIRVIVVSKADSGSRTAVVEVAQGSEIYDITGKVSLVTGIASVDKKSHFRLRLPGYGYGAGDMIADALGAALYGDAQAIKYDDVCYC